MQLLDGKKVSEDIKNEIAAEVAQMKANGEKVPHLAAIIVGNDGASLTYVGSKVKSCERVGFPGNSTVTVTHSHSKNINQITSQADIIISALGVPNFLKAEMVKDDVVVIDVGITRVEDETTEKGYRIVGDVDFENVSKKASYITPVPGGVGPMTIAMLLKNTLLAREQKRNR
jgi:5,10-methylene-tetrahydrofolate dehydrogenase/methenyl tetrahydrofolate cyclohydrolase